MGPSQEQKNWLAVAATEMELAARKLETAVRLLANFKTEDVPPLHGESFDIFAKPINRIDKANGFLKSFCRVAVLPQLAELAKENKKAKA